MFNLSFLLSPIGIILALGAALLLLYDDWKTWKEGGKSAIDWGSKTGTAIKTVVTGLRVLTGVIVAAKVAMMAWAAAVTIWGRALMFYNELIAFSNRVTAVWTAIVNGAKYAMALFNAVMTANPIMLVIAAIAALILIGYELIKHWDTVKKWFHKFFDWFLKSWKSISDAVGDFFGGSSNHKIEGTIKGMPLGADGARTITVNQHNITHINGAQSPHATAQAVASRQNDINANMVRHMTAKVR
jgi:hypothetical protein